MYERNHHIYLFLTHGFQVQCRSLLLYLPYLYTFN